MTDTDRETRRMEEVEWRCFTAADAYAALAGGADELFAQQLRVVGAVYDRLGDKSNPLCCAMCLEPISTRVGPGLIGWLNWVKRDEIRPFALCHACVEESDGFRERFQAAILGPSAYDIAAGRA